MARWRLQLAARLLRTTQKTILHAAMDVGYESDAAFNRAFKREFGLPPAQYRRKLAADGNDQPGRLNGDGTSGVLLATLRQLVGKRRKPRAGA
jgi:AraC-like DNA-binding protein